MANTPSDSHQPTERQLLRSLQVILGALMLGMLALSAIAIVLSKGAGYTPPLAPDSKDAQVLLLVMGVLAVGASAVSTFLAGLSVKQARQVYATEDGRTAVARVLVTNSIARAAVCEACGMLGGVIVLLSTNLLGLAGVAFGVLMVGALLPVRSRFESLLDRAGGPGPGM